MAGVLVTRERPREKALVTMRQRLERHIYEPRNSRDCQQILESRRCEGKGAPTGSQDSMFLQMLLCPSSRL